MFRGGLVGRVPNWAGIPFWAFPPPQSLALLPCRVNRKSPWPALITNRRVYKAKLCATGLSTRKSRCPETRSGRGFATLSRAGRSNAETIGFYDPRNDDISMGEVERIGI
jgi:hypothetical protein